LSWVIMLAKLSTVFGFILSFYCLISCLGLQKVEAAVTFTWLASPSQDEIVGYRLYYGKKSRWVAGKYEKYIDFTSMQTCSTAGDGSDCLPLPAGSVSCQDLFRDAPRCTVKHLDNRFYFALTAYNNNYESEYSSEISGYPSSLVKRVLTLQKVYHLLDLGQ